MRGRANRSITERLLDGETIDLGRLPGASAGSIYSAPVRLTRDGRVELTSGFDLDRQEVAILKGQILRDVAAAMARRGNRR